MLTLEELEEKKQKRKGLKFKVRNSFGVYDAYKLMRKNHWYNIGRPLKEKEFYAIIRGVNNLLAEEILKGNTVKFPAWMGKLELIKYEVGATFNKTGQLRITYPINWKETWDLWKKDEEAFKEKVLMRYETPFVYRVRYCKREAKYANKMFYQFVLNQHLKKKLKKVINSGETDTLFTTKKRSKR